MTKEELEYEAKIRAEAVEAFKRRYPQHTRTVCLLEQYITGYKQGVRLAVVRIARGLMDTRHLTAEEALRFLLVPDFEKAIYIDLLQQYFIEEEEGKE